MLKRKSNSRPSCPRLDIRIGDFVLVELMGVGGRFKAPFVGMVPGKVLIMRYPSIAHDLREHIYPEKALLVRFLSSGSIYGFKSNVSGLTHRPIPLLHIEYPTEMDVINLRKSRRVDCLFPVKIESGGESLEAMIINVSRDGCRVAFGETAREKAAALEQGQAVNASFKFVGSERVFELKSEIKNVYQENAHSLGLAFEHANPEIKQEIEKYIEDLKQYFV